ncbi:hypothetical protein V7799_04805 [Rhizobium laguerreae]
MADRPILFSATMIRALLDGRKTLTRRNFPQPFQSGYFQGEVFLDVLKATSRAPKAFRFSAEAVGGGAVLNEVFEPKINEGDRLWVRENAAVRYQGWHHEDGDTHSVSYRADEDETGQWLGFTSCGNGIRKGKAPSVFPRRSHNIDGSLRWQPSIHMPRWASRITLTVTNVRVERLQDITEADAIAEGAKQYSSSTRLSRAFNPDWKGIYREGYAELWNEINGAGAWESNPWIVAYSFTVHRQNIDAMSKEAA